MPRAFAASTSTTGRTTRTGTSRRASSPRPDGRVRPSSCSPTSWHGSPRGGPDGDRHHCSGCIDRRPRQRTGRSRERPHAPRRSRTLRGAARVRDRAGRQQLRAGAPTAGDRGARSAGRRSRPGRPERARTRRGGRLVRADRRHARGGDAVRDPSRRGLPRARSDVAPRLVRAPAALRRRRGLHARALLQRPPASVDLRADCDPPRRALEQTRAAGYPYNARRQLRGPCPYAPAARRRGSPGRRAERRPGREEPRCARRLLGRPADGRADIGADVRRRLVEALALPPLPAALQPSRAPGAPRGRRTHGTRARPGTGLPSEPAGPMKHPAVLATLAFVVGFYLNVPVVVAGAAGLPRGSASVFALLLAVPVVLALVVGRQPLVVTPALALMVAWLVVLVVSSIAAGADAGPAAMTTFLTEGLLLYLLVVNAVRSPAMMRWVIWALLIAGGTMGAISVWQEATHAYHQTLLGFAQVNDAAFKVADTVNGKVLRPRLSGPIGEQNRYGQILLVLVPLAVSRIRAERSLALRSLAVALTALILAGIVLSFSRGAAVALAVVAVAMVVIGFVRLRYLLVTGLALAVLVISVVPESAQRVRTRA